jgi:hypothetical protein
MFPRVQMNVDEDAQAGFREWVQNSSEESGLGEVARPRQVGLVVRHQDAVAAGRRNSGRTGRPICFQRLDLVQEQRAPALCLVKLEPLNEP